MRFLAGKNWAAGAARSAIMLGNLAVAAALMIYAYLGTFSRYLADDYCQAVLLTTSGNIFQATIKSYRVWSDRYSNLILIQFIEWGGKWGSQLMSAVALVLWVCGLTWLISEIGKSIGQKWNLGTYSWIAGLVIFLSLFEAPNLYQVLYWRAGLVTYLAPLVFFVYCAALILWQIRTGFQQLRLWGAGLICFGSIFIAGGSSETTSFLQIGILLMAFLIVLLQRKQDRRGDVLILLGVSLASAVLSMLVMAVAPGNGVRLKTPTSNVIALFKETITYSAQFILVTLKTLPLPALISIVIPLLVTFIYYSQDREKLSQIPSSRLWLTAAVLPVFLFIAVAFSFAPSAYAQSFPVDRARFPADFLMTLGLSAEGWVLGTLTSRIRLPFKSAYLASVTILVLCLLALYPLRAAYNVYSSVEPEYHQWTAAWDARQEQIFVEKAQGQMDIVVPQLPGIGYVKELDTRPNFWVNRCAAVFYGIHSLAAPQVDP
jgi:hypothetical protein